VPANENGFRYGVTWTPGLKWSERFYPPADRCRGTVSPTCTLCGPSGPTTDCDVQAARTAVRVGSEGKSEEVDGGGYPDLENDPFFEPDVENLVKKGHLLPRGEPYEMACEMSMRKNCVCPYD
jgi:hypothetical protein